MEDEDVSTEDAVIEPVRTEPAVIERVETLITELIGRVDSIDDRLTVIESSASNADGNSDAEPDGSGDTHADIHPADDNPETEAPNAPRDVKRPKREHPYFRRLW